jgi:indolepyruvate decarboxylase
MLTTAVADSARLHLLNVLLDPADRSAGMIRFAKRLSTDRP